MNVSELCIRRPVMTVLIMAGILIFGVMSYRLMPVSDLPNVDFPTISVSASLPGASPETMASTVALPLEKQFSTIAGIDSMTSVNGIGSTSITLQFDLDRDIDAAAQDVQAAISVTQRQLPRDMPNPPSYRKVNPADSPILFLALTSKTLPLSTVTEYGETNIAQSISMVSGVAQVQVYGSQKYAVRIQLDPDRMATKGIGIDDVANAVRNANVNLPSGVLWGSHQAFTVQASGQLVKAGFYGPIIVAYRAGAPVRLADLGSVKDSVENDKVAAWFYQGDKGDRAIVLAVQRQPGTNTVEVVESIRALLPTFQAQLPAGVELNILYDRSESIRDSVQDVKFTLLLSLLLVILVIFLFLRKLSATIIPSLALPFSVLGTFSVMHLMGFSLDNLSLMALTLSVGFVVDDAIVMLENIVRHLEHGETVWQAAMKGSREIGFTIISMTISLAAVFIPVLFMGGIVGRLFHEFAVTIATAVLVSGVVSLTLTPMLSSRFLRASSHASPGKLYRLTEKVFTGMLWLYTATLRGVLKIRLAFLLLSLALMAWTGYLFYIIPKGFLPSEDTGRISAVTEAAQGISFDSMKQHQQALAEILRKNPNVEQFMSSCGSGGRSSAGNQGSFFIKLQPRDKRRLSADEVIAQLRPQLSGVPGVQVFLQNPPTIRIGGQSSKGLYQYSLQSPSFRELYQYAPLLEERLRRLPGLEDVTSDLLIKNPQVDVTIDRDKSTALGVSAYQLEDALYTAYGSRQISTIYAPNNQYQVLMELLPRFQQDPAAIDKLYVRAASGIVVPVPALATLRRSMGPLTVNHVGQLPAVTLSFNLKPGVSLGEAVGVVEREAQAALPSSITTSFQGTAQAFQDSLRGMGLLLIMAIVVIYIVLGILYESFVHPVTILSGLPSAGLGALLTLMLFKIDLNLYALVGIIMLIGIVKKNAIMMIDFALEAERTEGLPPGEAIFEACRIRFRPIMMTTVAALMGTLPIALGYGAGGEARQPLGLTVVGGLLVSQVITLYLTPVVYIYLDKLQRVFKR